MIKTIKYKKGKFHERSINEYYNWKFDSYQGRFDTTGETLNWEIDLTKSPTMGYGDELIETMKEQAKILGDGMKASNIH